jgi:hypothetical protein
MATRKWKISQWRTKVPEVFPVTVTRLSNEADEPVESEKEES